MRRKLIKTIAWLAALAVVAGVSAYGYLRRSLPVVDGTVVVLRLSGQSVPSAPIDIVRDADDVPHIFAATPDDALYGLGYVHAQDRLWQMEFQRRVGNGRLSEIFGAATISTDRFLRTVGVGRAARDAWSRLPEDARRQIDAYVAGVNAFLAAHHGSLRPPELQLLGVEPEPWSGPDVLAWVKMMAWDLSGNYSYELMRHDLAAQVGVERMRELTPPYPADGLEILEGHSTAQARVGHSSEYASPFGAHEWGDAFVRGLSPAGGDPMGGRLLLGGGVEALGSNNWVVDGTMTASGKPLLANDPHLGAHMPSLWYLAHMRAGAPGDTHGFDVIGATLPGTPAVAIGRNGRIAWGETNVGADVEDLYVERLGPDGKTAEFQGAQEPIRVVEEIVRVKGGPPVTVTVRITRHGPLVSDAINANNANNAKNGAAAAAPAATTTPAKPPATLEPLAFRWTALDPDDRTIVAFLALNTARDWTSFTAALRDFSVPAQNFVYADVNGHIGYYAPGHVPLRARGDGSMPIEGWTGDAEWTGWIPFDDLPHVADPPSHLIVTANNRSGPAGTPASVPAEYPTPYRAERITALLAGRTRLTPDDFQAIQRDTVSLHAKALLPILLAHVHPGTALARAAVPILRAWNFDARGDSAAAAIFEAWFLRLAPDLVGDDLGPVALKTYEGRFSFVTRFVTSTLASPASPWCDDVLTPARETCDDIVTRALDEGLEALEARMGGDPAQFRWDGVHRAMFPHQGLDAVRLLRPLLSRSMPNGGDWSTVDVGAVDVDHPFNQISVSSFREIVDLSPADDSRFLDAVGQSGHVLSPHYDDRLQDWHDVRARPMRTDRRSIEAGAIGHLRLVPAAR